MWHFWVTISEKCICCCTAQSPWHFFGQLEACLLNLSQVWFLFWCRPDPESTDSFDTSWNLLQNVAKMITCCSWWRVWIMICIIRSSWAAYLPHDVCFVLVELCTGEATLLQLPLLQLHTWCLLSKRWTQIAMAWSRERSSKMQLQARGANSRLQSIADSIAFCLKCPLR
jgi:hypothetical protein